MFEFKLYYYKHQFVTVDRTLELYFQGCDIRCHGCQNEALWEQDEEHLRDVSDILNELKDYVPIAKCIHILGGEPLKQDFDAMTAFLKELREMFPNTPIYFFTGYNYNEATVHNFNSLPQFQYVDAVKVGSYREDALNISKHIDPVLGIALASTNQRGIRISHGKKKEEE